MGETERFELDDGWVLLVDGGVTDDGGFSGGHFSMTGGLAWTEEPSAEERAAATQQFEAEEQARAATVRHVRIEACRGEVAVVLADEQNAPLDGTVELYWPPMVSEAGLLLRHSRSSVTVDGRPRWDSESQHPWLIAPDGTVTQLPFELGVSPLCVLPDGRYLMPGADPLWRDDYDEPLSALAADGQLEPLQVDGQPLLPSQLVSLADASWAPERKRDEHGWPLEDFPFWAQRARIDGDELILLLADFTIGDWAEEGPYVEEPLRWLIAAVKLDGTALRLIAHGTVATDESPAIPW